MTYRAAPITQRDGSALASSNCRMASIATGIDYETGGDTTSTGAKMRSRQPDQSGGTDSSDAEIAWASYGADFRVGDGETFDDVIAALENGELVHLDVWHATAGGPCLSGSGAYGHTMAVAPERSGSRWLVADPWCSPPKWVWWEESKLRAGAERWGHEVYSTAGPGAPRERIAIIVRWLMSRDHPGKPRTGPDTGGSSDRVLFTTSSPKRGGSDMAVQAAGGGDVKPVTGYEITLSEGRDFHSDGACEERLGEMSATATVPYAGPVIGEDARAVYVKTGSPYADKIARWTLVYVVADAGSPVPIPPAPDPGPGPDVDEAIAARDEEWRDWALEGSPGSE